MAVGRYAPTPSGELHVGNLRTALLAHLFAAHADAPLRLRIDDLDPAATDGAVERSQLADLDAFEIEFAGPVLRQSVRRTHYDLVIEQLEQSGLAYSCFCSRREIREAATAPHEHLPDGAYPGTCRDLSPAEARRRAQERPAALRVRADRAEVRFVDTVYGETVTIVDDFVIRRNDGVPSYNVATVVDDAEQQVEQVVRGEDLRRGTGRQIWLAGVLGMPTPTYAHVPLVVNAEGRRLAKRDGAVTLTDLSELGWSPRRVRAVLAASIGLCEPDEECSTEELVDRFDPRSIPIDEWAWNHPGRAPEPALEDRL